MTYNPDQFELIEGIVLPPPERETFDYGLLYRRITSATDVRTVIAIPWARSLQWAIAHTAPIIYLDSARASALWTATFNSVVFDYLARNAIGNVNIDFFHLEQLPIPTPEQWEVQYNVHQTVADYCIERVVALTYTAHKYEEWAKALIPTVTAQKWQSPEVRMRLKAEIDVQVAKLYGVTFDELSHIFSQFPVWEKYDRKEYGSFRSRDLTLSLMESSDAD